MLNLIVIHQSFPCMFVGFNVMGPVLEIDELWRTKQLVANSRLTCEWSNPWKVTWGAHAGS